MARLNVTCSRTDQAEGSGVSRTCTAGIEMIVRDIDAKDPQKLQQFWRWLLTQARLPDSIEPILIEALAIFGVAFIAIVLLREWWNRNVAN